MRLVIPLLALAVAACGPQEPERITEAVPPPPAPLDDDPGRAGRTHVSFSFDELDLNDDGAIAATESAFDAQLSENFARYDTDANASLSRLEFDVARAAQHATSRR